MRACIGAALKYKGYPINSVDPKQLKEGRDVLLDAKVGAKLSNFNQYATPNKASRESINPDDLKNPAIYPPRRSCRSSNSSRTWART